MARGKSTIVGGGIAAGTPFALNGVTFVTSVDPAQIGTADFLSVVPTGVNRGLIVGLSDPSAGPERLRVKGGTILESLSHGDTTCIGDGTDSGASGQILIGNGITPNAQNNSIVIGNSAVGPSGGGGMVIGNGSSLTGAGICIQGTNSVASANVQITIGGTSSGGTNLSHVNIGGVCSVTTGVTCVGQGTGVGSSASNSVSVGGGSTMNGSGCVGVGAGHNANVAHVNSIAIGNGCQTIATQTCSIGSNVGFNAINQFIVGHGLDTVASPTGVTFRLTNASGTDNLAGNYTVRAGLSTGNIATGGNIVFQTGAPGASGTTLQTATTRLTIGQAAIISTLPLTLPAGAVGAPALIFTDADTGLFEQAAGNVAVAVNGVESARFSGGAAGETNFMLFDVDNATLERVSVGAADSGGVGFKVLRIPN